MQYKVPQNIDIEDKIIGPLTMKQFVYLLSGGLIAYISYSYLGPTKGSLIAIPAILLALMLTFVKVQDQPFIYFLASFALYLVKPKKRVWRKEESLESLPKQKIAEMPKIQEPEPSAKIEKSQLEQLSHVLDTGGWQDIVKHQKDRGVKIPVSNNKEGVGDQTKGPQYPAVS